MPILVKEAIGIIATFFIFISMLYDAETPKGNLKMRILNFVGCAIFMVYGILIPAISTAILNFGLVVVNAYHLIKIIKHNKTDKGNA